MTDPPMPTDLPFVSVILPIRNEAGLIADTLAAVLAQDYPHDRLEILAVDGLSTDGTRELVREVVRGAEGQAAGAAPIAVSLLDNPGLIVPTALNIGIRCARGEIIVRVDGHTIIAADYVRQCVQTLQRSGADDVGGAMRAAGTNTFGKAVVLATSSPFGVGGARFHYSDREEWVDTVYLGAWPRQVFERVGLFDEEMVRDQDDEFNYRLRKHGGRILHNPKIRSRYTSRSSLRGLWKQYFQYGFWKVRVLQKHPRQMQPRQLVPPLFVASLLGAALLAPWTIAGQWLLALVGGAYLIANLTASLWAARRGGRRGVFLLPPVFAILHLSYGLGFLIGLIRFWNRWGDTTGRVPAWNPGSGELAQATL